MKRKKASRTPTFMISCTSFLGRLIENGPIKNFEVRDECYVLDDYDYMFFTRCANTVLRHRTTDLQIATEWDY